MVQPLTGIRTAVSRLGCNRHAESISASIFTLQQWTTVEWGQVALKSMVETHGSTLPDSIPVPVDAGDVVVHNRNLVHGSFTNHSADLRLTVYFGYHHRQTVTGVFTSDHVYQREKVVALAIQRWTEFEPVAEDKDKSAPAAEVPRLDSNRFHSVVRHLSAKEEAVILRVPPLAI